MSTVWLWLRCMAFETTLRSPITFEQAMLARAHGFLTRLYYVSAGSVDESIRRIKERAWSGGHSAPAKLVCDIYGKSTRSLITAFNFRESAIQIVRIYDNSERFQPDKLRLNVPEVMTVREGRVTHLANPVPSWLEHILRDTKYDLDRLRHDLQARSPSRDYGPEL